MAGGKILRRANEEEKIILSHGEIGNDDTMSQRNWKWWYDVTQ